MPKKKRVTKSVSLRKYNLLKKDYEKALKANVFFIELMKELNYTLPDKYIETYNYDLSHNIKEIKMIVTDSVDMSPTHLKDIQKNNNSVVSLPEQVMQHQRALASNDTQK